MKIADVVKLRDEVLKGEIQGWDRLRGIFEQGKKEADPNYIFGGTYPSIEIKNLLKAVDEKLKGRSIKGFFAIMGGYGTGKSRTLCLLYHLFSNQHVGQKWLKAHQIELDLPKNAVVLAFSLIDDPPTYLWEPIFKGLGREELLKEVKNFPGTELLKKALQGKGLVVVIIDEVESWYRGVKDKDNNLNFIQVLGEVACEEDSNLIIFCALYGEDKELLGRIERVNPYRVNLTLSKDREKIILYRLIESIDLNAVEKVVNAYMMHYRASEVEIMNAPSYEKRMKELYPIHPELMDTLLTRYSSSVNYQNTRGVLYLLASVIVKRYQNVDLLLASDIDMSLEADLLSLDRVLTENAQKDADLIGRDDVKRVLNVVLLYSFGAEKNTGASRNDIVFGTLRPGINVNDIDTIIVNLPNLSPHVWLRNDKYIIGREENIVTLIQNKAEEAISKGKIDEALQVIKEKLRKDRDYLVYHPNSNFSDVIDDVDRIRIVVSLKELSQHEINKFYEGKQFANRLILYIPKKGDLTRDQDLLVVAQRIRLYDQYEKEVTGEKKSLLERQKDRDYKNLKDKLSEIYGYWVRITGYEKGEIKYRLVHCSIDAIRPTVQKSYDVETMRGEILGHLDVHEKGLKVEDIKYDFKTIPGKPMIIMDAIFEDALRLLYDQEEIVIEYKGRLMRKPDPLVSIKDDMKVILTKYATHIPEVIEVEVEKKQPVTPITPEEQPAVIPEKPKVEIEIKEPPKEHLLETLETSEHTSPFSLSYEVERKLAENARIRNMIIEFFDSSFNDIDALKSFISSIDVKKSKVSGVSLKLFIEGPFDKKEVIDLIDNKLPKSLSGGRIKALIGVEKIA